MSLDVGVNGKDEKRDIDRQLRWESSAGQTGSDEDGVVQAEELTETTTPAKIPGHFFPLRGPSQIQAQMSAQTMKMAFVMVG